MAMGIVLAERAHLPELAARRHAPPVRDYVIIHELMHLKRMDHSRRFWTLVEAACPDYQAARAWLRTCRRA
jgi:predicted metal-dependent hydrolase